MASHCAAAEVGKSLKEGSCAVDDEEEEEEEDEEAEIEEGGLEVAKEGSTGAPSSGS